MACAYQATAPQAMTPAQYRARQPVFVRVVVIIAEIMSEAFEMRRVISRRFVLSDE